MDHYDEIRQVEELGEKIGYGNMMSIASAIWAKKLGDDDGAVVPTLFTFIKDKHKDAVREELKVERSWVDNYFLRKELEQRIAEVKNQ